MALNLRACRDCDHPVSRRARVCPHCGAPVGWPRLGAWGVFLGLAFAVLLVVYLAPEPSPIMRPARRWIEANPRFGEPESCGPVLSWLGGRRQDVRFRDGSTLRFVASDGRLIAVRDRDHDDAPLWEAK